MIMLSIQIMLYPYNKMHIRVYVVFAFGHIVGCSLNFLYTYIK